MLIAICIAHNFVNYGKGWEEADEDVCDIAQRLKKPTCINPTCPKCQEVQKRTLRFLRR